MRPRERVSDAASVREEAPSRSKAIARWAFTPWRVIPTIAAISSLLNPFATSLRMKGFADGIGEVLRVQGVAPEIPQALAQFAPARGEDAFRRLDLAGVKLHCRSRQGQTE